MTSLALPYQLPDSASDVVYVNAGADAVALGAGVADKFSPFVGKVESPQVMTYTHCCRKHYFPPGIHDRTGSRLVLLRAGLCRSVYR